MDELAAKRVTRKMAGLWGKLIEDRLEAYDTWLRRTCRASEDEVMAAVDALAETAQHMPRISEIVDQLREMGALKAQPTSIAIVARAVREQVAEYIAVRKRLDEETAPSFVAAVEAHRGQCVANAADAGDAAGIWADRIAACDRLLADEGVRV